MQAQAFVKLELNTWWFSLHIKSLL